ncbi:tyrosine recombinase XerC [Kitasatospora phosalacinea]|uniref:site-specific integrase n=1 Tax=Kitasatospora phosalacinea TaxID=2065 RepID=UPI0035D89A93
MELYQRLLRLHLLPTFAELSLAEIASATVRTWHARKKANTGATTVAKSYRLLKAIMETAADDESIPRNPCRIKGAGEEHPDERPVATVGQVFELAEYMGPRWRMMVFLAAFASLRPEELAALRRRDVDVDRRILRITEAAPELNSGQRVTGETKSRAGKRKLHLPPFLDTPLRQHMAWFAEEGPEGYLFVGELGGRLRASTFGRKFRRARAKVGRSAQSRFASHEFVGKEQCSFVTLPAADVPIREILKGFDEQGLAELAEEEELVEQVDPLPENFTFYDLRGTGNSLLAEEGASLKDLMVRMGHSSVRAAMIYQHSTDRRQRELAAKMESRVRRDIGTQQPQPPRPGPPHGTSDRIATVHPIRRRA